MSEYSTTAISRDAGRDGSGLWLNLLIGNGITAALAFYFDWTLTDLMWPYWMQSVAIGLFNVRRMLVLRSFSTKGLTSGGNRVPENAAGKWSTAVFFLFHYGLFHLVYAVFIAGGVSRSASSASPNEWLITGAVLLVMQFITHLQDVRSDRAGKPNLGTMMFLPYLRIIPMHLTIIFGAMAMFAGWTIWLFMSLKTLADVLTTVGDHALTAGGKTAIGPRG